jgi:hypothetical protein
LPGSPGTVVQRKLLGYLTVPGLVAFLSGSAPLFRHSHGGLPARPGSDPGRERCSKTQETRGFVDAPGECWAAWRWPASPRWRRGPTRFRLRRWRRRTSRPGPRPRKTRRRPGD